MQLCCRHPVDYPQEALRQAIGLEAGAHAIRVDHTQGRGGQELPLDLSGPGIAAGERIEPLLSHARVPARPTAR